MSSKNIKEEKTVEDVLDPTSLEENGVLSDDIIEVDWEELAEVFALRQETRGLETYFSNMALNFERAKGAVLSRLFQAEEVLYAKAEEVKTAKNVDPSLTYELKMPEKEGEKGYFVKKQ